MDYDETVNISTFDSNDEMPASVSRDHLTQEIIFTIFFIIGICADILIIYTILRFKRMRSVPNIFLANWAIADLCCLVVTPSAYRLTSALKHFSLSHEFICFMEESGATLHITVILFVMVVVLDWFIAAYFGGASEKFRSRYKIVIGSIWLFAIIWSSIYSIMCMSISYYLIHQEYLLLLCYAAVLLAVIVFQGSRVIQKIRNVSVDYPTLMLTLPTAFIINSVLSFLALIFDVPFRHQAFEIIAVCLLFSSSIVNLILLYFLDKDFHACFLQAMKRSGDRYEETISEFDNPIRNTDHKDNVKISFHNSEELLSNVD